jgi:large subunit ribosomal protein L20
MVRTTRGNTAAKRRKKTLKLAKGFVSAYSKLSTFAKEQVVQSLAAAYKGRKLKKRNFRRIWIYRINATRNLMKINYSEFIGILRKSNILLDRKSLSAIVFNDLIAFTRIIRKIKSLNLIEN